MPIKFPTSPLSQAAAQDRTTPQPATTFLGQYTHSVLIITEHAADNDIDHTMASLSRQRMDAHNRVQILLVDHIDGLDHAIEQAKGDWIAVVPAGEALTGHEFIPLHEAKPEALHLPDAPCGKTLPASRHETMESAWESAERYSTDLRTHIERVAQARRIHDMLPPRLARKIALDLAKHVKRLLNQHLHAAQVPQDLVSSYRAQLAELLNAIDPAILLSLELDDLQEKHKVAMLALGHPGLPHVSRLLPIEFDADASEFCLRYYYTGPQPELAVRSGANELEPIARKIRAHRFFDTTLLREQIAWFSWPGPGALRVKVNGARMDVRLPGDAPRTRPAATDAVSSPDTSHRPGHVRLQRMLAQLPPYMQQFKHAWLFMDRDTQADDNAEHLYRYIRRHHPEINAWFVLRESSHDWRRLKAEGFRLLPFGALSHRLALLNADHVVSSHADPYVAQYLPKEHYGDLMKFRYTFLQHGVTKDDLSGWLNYRPIRHFITSAQAELDSIISDDSGYRYTAREVALSGMPRHDALIRKRAQHPKPSRIVIMPTWRHSLMGKTLGMTNDRTRNPDFAQSGFFKAWHGLLTDPRLLQMAQRHGHEIVFFPHANLQPYLEEFKSPQVQVLGHGDVASIQELFLDTAVLVTDYSSVAFELAYLERPMLYYQFDVEEIYQGGHFIRKGYFDHHNHGFGPVCADRDALLESLAPMLESAGKPAQPYAQRMKDFFAFRDGRCCERVFALIAQAGAPGLRSS